MREKLFSITKRDLVIDYFSGTGAGGQYRNKHQNCVRLYHKDSGVRVTGQSNRNRQANLREAFKSFVAHPQFKLWHARKIQECIAGKTIEQQVQEMMAPENLKVEVKDHGGWKELAQ